MLYAFIFKAILIRMLVLKLQELNLLFTFLLLLLPFFQVFPI